MRSIRALALAAMGLLSAACADTSPDAVDIESTSVARSAIVGGSVSSSAQDAVVLLMGKDARGAVDITCTATLVAANVVVTARHCVSYSMEDSIICDQDGRDLTGGAEIVGERKPSDVGIIVGDRRETSNIVRVAARGRHIFVPPRPSLCGADIAFVVLDKEIKNAKVAPIRISGGPSLGDRVTVVGWGLTTDGSDPDQRQQRTSLDIRRIGPMPADGRVPPLGTGEFELGESICAGDSGGPAFDEATGALLGVVSRGGNGLRKLPESCLGERVVNAYTSLASFAELTTLAFAAAGKKPWLEGTPDPMADASAGEPDGGSCTLGRGRSPLASSAAAFVAGAAMLLVARRRASRRSGSDGV